MYYAEKEHTSIFLEKLRVEKDMMCFFKDFQNEGMYKHLNKSFYHRGTEEPTEEEIKAFSDAIIEELKKKFYKKNDSLYELPYKISYLSIYRRSRANIMIEIELHDIMRNASMRSYFSVCFNKETNEYESNETSLNIYELGLKEYEDSIEMYPTIKNKVLSLKEGESMGCDYPRMAYDNFFVPKEYYFTEGCLLYY